MPIFTEKFLEVPNTYLCLVPCLYSRASKYLGMCGVGILAEAKVGLVNIDFLTRQVVAGIQAFYNNLDFLSACSTKDDHVIYKNVGYYCSSLQPFIPPNCPICSFFNRRRGSTSEPSMKRQGEGILLSQSYRWFKVSNELPFSRIEYAEFDMH